MIAALADLSRSVNLARLIHARFEAKMRSERFRGAEAAGVVDREVGHGSDAGDGHRTAPDVRALGRRGKGPIHRLSFPNEAPIRLRIHMELETRPQTGPPVQVSSMRSPPGNRPDAFTAPW